LERVFDKTINVDWGDWRPGDQKVYISDIRKAKENLGWAPKVGVEEGVERLATWVKDNLDLF
jgi:CDP-paratose 2-epimerase